MRISATKVFMVLVAVVSLAALGCSGEQTPGDTGVGEDKGGGEDGDVIVLCETDAQCGPGKECRGGV